MSTFGFILKKFLGCPTNWYRSAVDKSQCYRLYNSTLVASDAQFACQNSTLTSLISIDSVFENADIACK